MPHRLLPDIGSILSAITGLLALAAKMIADSTGNLEEMELSRWLYTPVVGSCFTSLICYLFNPLKDTKRILAGRVLASILCSVIGVWLTAALLPSYKDVINDTRSVFTLSVVITFIVFYLIRPFAVRWARNSDKLAEEVADNLEERARLKLGIKPTPEEKK